ncbi:DUF3748 domain-containing protein [Parachryseolinea silvisoli]|uniref:DUF3748 domain-containing protein n=1 Tax=Parachryseolinea silvisoli TaxID=2873601 RepID=UPI002265A64D|nr:DUF3748 domain-containing protein [Parachryseolinea silvisoli]MCD9018955.1 DUF3748 domain-containing protein [Parachryseolinea silvisoli]
MPEQQLTSGKYGHTLNATQVFSPDDQRVVYDTRNDDTHIGRTEGIEMVNVTTGEVVRLYTTAQQTLHGPGVGAVAWNPRRDEIIFIHGLENADASRPYSMTRRFGALLNPHTDRVIRHAEARVVQEPFVAGALRGGTHAHTWSGDGAWISFTYNDVLVGQDLRTVGVMAPGQHVAVPVTDCESFAGEYFTVVVATVTEHQRPGSDDIGKAFDECWIGQDGYLDDAGQHHTRAIAFQGNVRSEEGTVVTEVFVADLPDDVTLQENGLPLAGTGQVRPQVPRGVRQRRVTYTGQRKHPGLQGPRFRLRTSPDGAEIYFLMKDDADLVQLYRVPTAGGNIVPLTWLAYSIQGQCNISPDGRWVSFLADNSVWVTDATGGTPRRLTARTHDAQAPVGGALWNHRGDRLVYNRYDAEGFLQIYSIHAF